MSTATDLRNIFDAARPLVEQALDLTEQFAAIRDAATAKGIDWSQVKALVKAAVQDERDGESKRVDRIVEKADFASAYADMLGLKMNENNNIPDEPDPPPALTIVKPEPSRPAPIKKLPDDEGIPDFLDRRARAS